MIIQAAYHGISIVDSTLYCTNKPCVICSKMIINAGIAEVIYEEEYRFSDQAGALLRTAGVKCRCFRQERTENA